MKNSKKVLVSLAATLILSTSVGQAQGLKYSVKKNTSNESSNHIIRFSNLSNKFLNNRFDNILSQLKTIWNWDDLEDNNKDESTEQGSQKPDTPEEKTEKPTKPVESDNNANSSIEQEVARLVNIERQKAGLAPLTLSTELSNVARIKSQDMANKNYFSHTSPTYGDPFEMMRSFGIKFGYAGENIAKGYKSAESVMNGWMNSSEHRANILNPNFKTVGVGYVNANGTTYWTQMFTD